LRTEAPPGTKALDATVVGSLTATAVSVILPKIIDLLGQWVNTKKDRKIILKTTSGEVEITGPVPADEIRAAIEKLSAKSAS
jgi:hypothetical protein